MISAVVYANGAASELLRVASRVRVAARSAVDNAAAMLGERVRQKLSGDVLNARSGALRRSITAPQIASDARKISASIGSDGSVPYARIQEYGGRIEIPEIRPKAAKALAFEYSSKLVFAKRTSAHPATIPERSYLRSALADEAQRIADSVEEAVMESLA